MTLIEGKLTALASLLKTLRQVYQIEWCMFIWKLSNKQHTEEKCILVSHYTSTLNILEAFCKKQSYTYLRLDGCVQRKSWLRHHDTGF
jgi:DNA repair and recombination protein RAD54B